MAATGARINVNKSKAMAVNSWDTDVNVMDITYVEEMKILDIRFSTPINQAAKTNWDVVTGRIRALTRDTYHRDLCLALRITYIHCYILATAWYTPQIFPVHETHVQQINSVLAWFLWRGEIFRVPLSTLQLSRFGSLALLLGKMAFFLRLPYKAIIRVIGCRDVKGRGKGVVERA
jgi:hypothetical protein